MQPDILQQALLKQQTGISFREIQQLLRRRKPVAKLRQTPYTVTLSNLSDLNLPKLLVPANPNRMSLKIATLNLPRFFIIYYSYNFPVPTLINFTGFTKSFGIDISFANSAPTNGTISTDDIYVTLTRDKNFPAQPITVSVLAYEGVLAVESNDA